MLYALFSMLFWGLASAYAQLQELLQLSKNKRVTATIAQVIIFFVMVL